MKEISDLKFPDNLRYSEDHEWVAAENGTIKIGISDYAQDQLGDVVFVELPAVGDTFAKGDEFGTVESVKAVSELYIPMAGEVVAINENLEDAPELLNTAPYDDGWLIVIKPEDASELDDMLAKDAYLNMLKNQA
jgi:glycine cleavage system H protein